MSYTVAHKCLNYKPAFGESVVWKHKSTFYAFVCALEWKVHCTVVYRYGICIYLFYVAIMRLIIVIDTSLIWQIVLHTLYHLLCAVHNTFQYSSQAYRCIMQANIYFFSSHSVCCSVYLLWFTLHPQGAWVTSQLAWLWVKQHQQIIINMQIKWIVEYK